MNRAAIQEQSIFWSELARKFSYRLSEESNSKCCSNYKIVFQYGQVDVPVAACALRCCSCFSIRSQRYFSVKYVIIFEPARLFQLFYHSTERFVRIFFVLQVLLPL